MTPDNPAGGGTPGTPRFDPRRSTEIRDLLTETVSHSPRPRVARLSRTRFALAATAALLFAGGAGAATVVAYDTVSDSTVAEQSRSESAESAGRPESTDGPESAGTPATSGFTSRNDSGGSTESALIPFVTLDGETGYAFASEVESAQAAATGTLLDASADAEPLAAPTRVPIYRSDGTTVLGYYEFAPQAAE